ncbi:MAG: hypothetical protein IPK02_04560 [Candidatus Accumulibacter sp.]|uniref:Uncharacterized protein n=1 Tax=Candidatus Accumulibacter affinis TaxID=2954384 RepID=A0A935T9G4_9PROT|nr:hypothetical protein [Candidatus Accumulibacter affinis]
MSKEGSHTESTRGYALQFLYNKPQLISSDALHILKSYQAQDRSNLPHQEKPGHWRGKWHHHDCKRACSYKAAPTVRMTHGVM